VKNARQDRNYALHPSADSSTTLASISTLVELVSQPRWFTDVTTLAGYNRFTRGTGIAAAQAWIINQLSLLTNITVTTQPFTSGATSGVNVIGTIKGTTLPNNLVIIGGHYDSTSQSTSTAAPGAEDNASGAAAVLEMARIFNAHPPAATALFIFFSGEEQGLLGSVAHAQSLVNAGNATKVKLMHNMDMISYQQNANGPKQVLLETSTAYTSLFPYYRESAIRYTTLGVFESTTAWGSDHEPYIRRNMPALLTIDYDWDIYPYYHTTQDTPDRLNPGLGYQLIRLGVGAVAQVLGYPF
jgi:Zn-dependent M28 family amino/carboxypeptidase